jgi:HAMP domain-containing protein
LPLAEIQRQFQDLRRQIVIAGLAAWLLIGCFSFWLAGRLSYPIQKLAAVAEKVRRGDLEANFQHRSRDELGELADHLNQMLNKLRRDMVQLRKLEQVRSNSRQLFPTIAHAGFYSARLSGNLAPQPF